MGSRADWRQGSGAAGIGRRGGAIVVLVCLMIGAGAAQVSADCGTCGVPASSPSGSGSGFRPALGLTLDLLSLLRDRDTAPAPLLADPELPLVRRVYGEVRCLERVSGTWQPLTVGARLPAGAAVRTAAGANFEATIGERGIFLVGERSSLEIRQADAGGHQFTLFAGQINNAILPAAGRSYLVRTGTADVYIRGTEFDVEVDEQGRTLARTWSGAVGVRTTDGETLVEAGHEAVVARDGSRVTIRHLIGPPPSPFGFTAAWDDPAARRVAPRPSGSPAAAEAAVVDPAAYPAADRVLQVSGEWTEQDLRRENGTAYDLHTLPMRAGETFVVQLGADADPYLIVRAPGGEVVENDDVSRHALTAQLRVTATRDGTLEIRATASRSPATGPYRLFVGREGAPRPDPAAGDTVWLSLQWFASPGAGSYRVYVLERGAWRRFAASPGPGLRSTALPRGTPRVLCVTAVGETGESKPGENALALGP